MFIQLITPETGCRKREAISDGADFRTHHAVKSGQLSTPALHISASDGNTSSHFVIGLHVMIC
jgi:hypothetical protein